MACAVTAAMQALLELVAQIASEMEIVQKNEVVLLSISAFLEQRLFASEEVYRERDSFYYIIVQTYDVGLHSRRHPRRGIHIHKHARTRTYTRTYARARVHMCTHTHTYMIDRNWIL